MNPIHASLFALLGVLLFFVPAWDPAGFTQLGPDGTCASALWLGLMGLVLHALGTGWLLIDGLHRLRVAVETFDLELPWLDTTEVRWSMSASHYALLTWEANGMPVRA